ncbi:MAG: hypothetical protein IJ733_09105 [Lachnospiraceae bacterium]|nr:hypothetical protein [Lachnospiraceae bacterium]
MENEKKNGHFKNIKTVVYIPAQVAASFTEEKLSAEYGFLEKYIGLDKVYLETHRWDCDVEEEQIKRIKGFLEGKGVEVSGGITTTIDDFDGAEAGKQRLFGTFCYTDPAMRERIKRISEYTAGLFDEVILDDFYFTNCTCERCIKEKGDRDWVTFRRELMKDVSENLIVRPARAVNSDVRMVIKYPNWRESYHFTGYLPDEQREIFDATFIGTETRSPSCTDQHLPEYLSYALVRYMENAWQGRNGGGWFDTYQCFSIDRYLEQAYLTAFAQAKELMHFQWSDLIGNPFTAPLGLQFERIDGLIDGIGRPAGVPTYVPFASNGENHLEMRLGMLGIPVEPVPEWPEQAERVFLTESAAADEHITEKLVKFIENGSDAIITTGLFRKIGEGLRKAGVTEAEVTNRKLAVTRYQVTGDEAGYTEHREPVLFPEIVHGNNASWSLLNGGDGDYHAPLFLRSAYGRGRLYIMAVPDNYADIYRLPPMAADVFRRILCPETYASGSNFSMFPYESGSMILYRYVKGDLRPARVKLYTKKPVKALVDVETGERKNVCTVNIFEDFEENVYFAAEICLQPGIFRKLRWEMLENK